MRYEDLNKSREDLITERNELEKKLRSMHQLYLACKMHLDEERAGCMSEEPCIVGSYKCEKLYETLVDTGNGKVPCYFCIAEREFMTHAQVMEDRS